MFQCLLRDYNKFMRCSLDSDSDYSPSSDSEDNVPARQVHQTALQQLISLNVTIFNDLGFTVSADSFSHALQDDEEEQPNNDSESERSEIDYGDSEEEENGGIEEEFAFEEEEQDQRNGDSQQSVRYRQWMQDQLSAEQSNESPFFPEAMRQEGLTAEEIRRIPTMYWGHNHNTFNRGEKCAVCLEDFQLGNALRVMACLHRYHLDCIDQWLALRATCPSCRTPPKMIHPH